MKTLIITVLLLLAGCALTPEQRDFFGAASYAIGNQWQNTMAEQRAIADYWENQRFQGQVIYEMQQQNLILQQRGCR